MPALKVVAAESKSELAPILRPRMAVKNVQVRRANGATHKAVQVCIVGANARYISHCLVLHVELIHDL